MIIRPPTETYRNSQDVFYRLLMSDLHFAAAWCDKPLIRSDLRWAREHNARIYVAGDIFDLILPKDHKRFVPSALDPELRGKDSILNAALDMAAAEFGPYADLIDMMGVGNHDTAGIKHHNVDMVALLIDRLQTKDHPIAHGGYTGAVVNTFRRAGGSGCRWVVWYHHGRGGNSAVTKGMIDFNRYATYVRDADVIWTGHKHHRWADDAAEYRIPLVGENFEVYPVKHVMSGAYDTGVHRQLGDDGAYLSDYANEAGFAPAGRGGVRLRVSLWNRGKVSSYRPITEVIL